MYKLLFLRNTKISIFGGISKIRFWANLGRFGQILLHWQWLTACLKFTKNLKNLITLPVVSYWKATNRFYLYFKSQVHQRIIATTAACPKQQKAILVAIDV
jgi:hypothetical protein